LPGAFLRLGIADSRGDFFHFLRLLIHLGRLLSLKFVFRTICGLCPDIEACLDLGFVLELLLLLLVIGGILVETCRAMDGLLVLEMAL
jgi:hypothetical protein